MKRLVISVVNGSQCCWLTDESCASRYGLPVFEILGGGENRAFGPADVIAIGPHRTTPAHLVVGWARLKGGTAEEFELARLFLSQWPAGPQLSSAV